MKEKVKITVFLLIIVIALNINIGFHNKHLLQLEISVVEAANPWVYVDEGYYVKYQEWSGGDSWEKVTINSKTEYPLDITESYVGKGVYVDFTVYFTDSDNDKMKNNYKESNYHTYYIPTEDKGKYNYNITCSTATFMNAYKAGVSWTFKVYRQLKNTLPGLILTQPTANSPLQGRQAYMKGAA